MFSLLIDWTARGDIKLFPQNSLKVKAKTDLNDDEKLEKEEKEQKELEEAKRRKDYVDIDDYLQTLKVAQEKLLSQSFSEYSEASKNLPFASVTPEILSQFSPLFTQFLAWQRLMQINQNLLNVHSKIQSQQMISGNLDKDQKSQPTSLLSPIPQSYSNYFNDSVDPMEQEKEDSQTISSQILNNELKSEVNNAVAKIDAEYSNGNVKEIGFVIVISINKGVKIFSKIGGIPFYLICWELIRFIFVWKRRV